MISFKDDYSEGCHPRILERLMASNFEQHEGYGDDVYSIRAKKLIGNAIGNTSALITFISGGTQANLTAIASVLRPHEAVVAAASGHISIHEAGAIEATGHKVVEVPSSDGKLTPNMIEEVLNHHSDVPHMVKPRMVYISLPTELGTLYSLTELQALSTFCKSNNLLLYLDGARLGSALSALNGEIEFKDIAALTDLFYIGATKNGGLLGEAMVITNAALHDGFMYNVKQRGALLAKGRLLGIQFLELFTDNLYLELAAHANQKARELELVLQENGYSFLTHSSTNQIFPILSNEEVAYLSNRYAFHVWSRVDAQNKAIRLVCSWNTTNEAIQNFRMSIDELKKKGVKN